MCAEVWERRSFRLVYDFFFPLVTLDIFARFPLPLPLTIFWSRPAAALMLMPSLAALLAFSFRSCFFCFLDVLAALFRSLFC